MPTNLVEVRTALDALSRAARPQIASLCVAIVAQCKGDLEPQFSATARLLDAVVALDKAIVADLPELIADAEVALGKAAPALLHGSEGDSL